MYECESWAIKKAECQRIDAFELWCWRRLLRAPCPARKSNQSILKEISPDYSLQGLMLKLRLQYSGYLMRIAKSLEKILMLGKIEGRREGDARECSGWIASPAQWTWVWASSRRWWRTGQHNVLQSMGSQSVGEDWATEQQKRQRQWLSDTENSILIAYLIFLNRYLYLHGIMLLLWENITACYC